jgi:tRNA G10  N-methylase Trm11
MFAGKKSLLDSAEHLSHSIWENFELYGLEKPEIIRLDNHLFGRHYSFAFSNFFDAIVTDPPYGIRAGAKKSGRLVSRGPIEIPDDLRESHVPATQQ